MRHFNRATVTEREVRATFHDFPDWGLRAAIALTDIGPAVVSLSVMPCEVEVDDEDGSTLEIRESRRTPPAGLPARALRQINVGELVSAAVEAARQIDEDPDGISEMLGESLFGEQRRRAAQIAGASRARPGRRGYPDEHYAVWAKRYVDKIDKGETRPIAALARDYGEPPTWIRDTINEARRRKGFLTTAGTSAGPGRAGGRLTERALEVLAEMEADRAER